MGASTSLFQFGSGELLEANLQVVPICGSHHRAGCQVTRTGFLSKEDIVGGVPMEPTCSGS